VTTNLAASVRQRLHNLARQQRLPYNRLQLLYLQERWLARLAKSEYRERFVLKGALYLYSRYGTASRPTRDIDLLGRATPAEVESLVNIMKQVAAVNLVDGVTFEAASIRGEVSQRATEYGGIRLEVKGYLGKAWELIRMDIGFGDAVTAGPVWLAYPTLLDTEAPELLAYSLETVIAEKAQAMAALYDINSRFKDYYDLYHLAATESFEAGTLHEAITTTFARRDTPLAAAERLFDPSFASNPARQRQWQVFLTRITKDEPGKFTNVLELIRVFLAPIVQGKATGIWQPEVAQWS
jgi:predicted nucleotidyltransferase component of viral defense system